ncbi:interferon-related developmental regulator-domain-containing protein [Microdochium trichocladiopsis]|uniref:Interferon-related developmental regulator-domain-containing protein n=1 Tax=Microdochium trichocladiopsis TaxID=1682393 RepID=A0A9P9BM05_9PEZI|nr:interferon-related developmental regulator-domain-containing protein [Microdochium trichocladiopsis]KAH7025780.1 interferon-related developmental regulator-domain-containing protein [Microdochium trichocladiopsis]
MHDLRKKALLESGKTMSRKARSRPESALHSPMVSPTPSRGGSRAPSRYASEDEANSSSDNEQSVASSYQLSDGSDEYQDGDDDATAAQPWDERLKDNIVGLLDRKRSSAAVRETMLSGYCHLLRHNYAEGRLDGQINDLLPIIMRSIRGGSTTEESVLALKALQITTISMESDFIYGRTFQHLKGVCEDSGEEIVKTESIIAMSVATMCGGGDDHDAESLLTFLTDIVASDGASIDAPDNGPVVTTALVAWGFVASQLDDLQSPASEAMDAFIEQLDSTDVDVQIAAGFNIALICESLREYEQENGEVWSLDYNKPQLINRMRLLTKESSKLISKKNRKQLHQSFKSVVTSLERGKGPGYSTALDENEREFGYREKLRFQNISLTIDSWALSVRIEMLTKVLRGGLATHYTNNPVVKDLLDEAEAEALCRPKNGKKNDTASLKKGRKAKAARNAMVF